MILLNVEFPEIPISTTVGIVFRNIPEGDRPKLQPMAMNITASNGTQFNDMGQLRYN